ncbi:MAG: hypothetical protein M0P71_13300 [Melioribacteraceae bacterium]|nr:hypothetical protein [Melioribacteraceae bacterium]
MSKNIITTEIEKLVTSLGFLPIEVNFRGDSKLQIVEVFLDNEVGVTSEDCSAIARAINELIEQNDLIESQYRLDVSSPGVDRPLKFLAQYKKHLNRKLEIEYNHEGISKKLTGLFIELNNDELTIKEKKDLYFIKFSDITKAKVLISF